MLSESFVVWQVGVAAAAADAEEQGGGGGAAARTAETVGVYVHVWLPGGE